MCFRLSICIYIPCWIGIIVRNYYTIVFRLCYSFHGDEQIKLQSKSTRLKRQLHCFWWTVIGYKVIGIGDSVRAQNMNGVKCKGPSLKYVRKIFRFVDPLPCTQFLWCHLFTYTLAYALAQITPPPPPCVRTLRMTPNSRHESVILCILNAMYTQIYGFIYLDLFRLWRMRQIHSGVYDCVPTRY